MLGANTTTFISSLDQMSRVTVQRGTAHGVEFTTSTTGMSFIQHSRDSEGNCSSSPLEIINANKNVEVDTRGTNYNYWM